jgi:hypothetical protein
MTKLTWSGDKNYEYGVDRGVFYPKIGPGEVWNGLTAVNETPSESDSRFRYLDGIKVSLSQAPGEFSGVIQAFTYPKSFYENVLTQRRAKNFGLSYRVMGRDSYKIHIVYNVVTSSAGPSYVQRDTTNFSWAFTTTAISVPGAKKSAHLMVDSSVAYSSTIQALEDILYGTDIADARLPTPQEVWDLVEANSIVLVVDHGDGTFTVTGPDDVITMLSSDTFEITWPSVVNIDANTYQISSL